MTTALFHQSQGNRKFLAIFTIGLLALAFSACSSRHGKLETAAQPTQTESSGNPCGGEDHKPSIHCAKSPTVAFDNKGLLWAVWDHADRIYVNHSNDLGKTFSEPVAVTPVAEPIEVSGEARPKIAVSKDGGIYVAWTKKLGEKHTGHIRFSHSLDHGKTFTAPVQANSDTAEIAHRFESLAVNDRGYIYLAWIDKRDKAAAESSGGKYVGAGLYYTYSSNGGRSFHAEKKLADHVCECCRVNVEIDRKQWPVVLWRHVFDGQIRDHVLSRFTAKDKPGPIERISVDNWKIDGCPHHGPALSITPKGAYYVVWFTKSETRQGLFFAGSNNQGKTFSEPVGFGKAAQATHPDILADDSLIHIVWKEFDGKQSQLLEQHSSDGGASWSIPKLLAETPSESDHPFLLDNQGRRFAAWRTQDQGFKLIPISD